MHATTRSVLLRALISATAGLVMIGITFASAFHSMRHARPYEDSHRTAFHAITSLMESLEEFREARGRYPESLTDLKDAFPGALETDSSGRLLDPWNHPYEYRSDGRSYTLRSLGLDGKPGGPGLAMDLDAREIIHQDDMYDMPRRAFRPTFWQYTFNLDTTAPVKVACALSGLFAAVACFVTLGHREIRQADMLGRLLTTLLMCFVVTCIITFLHTPNHH